MNAKKSNAKTRRIKKTKANQLPKLGKRLLAAQTDAPDFRDFEYKPALVNLKPTSQPPKKLTIRDQGREGACTGFGLAAAIDLLMSRSDRQTNVSTRMLYQMARRYDEWPGEVYEGSSCRGAIKGWFNMGVCQEDKYPYKASEASELTIDAAKDARNNTIGAYFRLNRRISDYHAALTEVGVVYCSAKVHSGWQRVNKKSGEIKYKDDSIGGHAFAIVGYDDKGFWVQNSWGETWGKQGLGHWSYEDWQKNIKDAWVFRLALSTPQIWHLPKQNQEVNRAETVKKPTRAEIAGHFVHIDDGFFHNEGRYWSDLNDVQQTAQLFAGSDKYSHLLFYAHGGLNSPTASATRIAAMKETFKSNGIYPYHLMYDTGILEELKDVLIGRRKKVDQRAGGLLDWIDRLIEKATRVPGRALWREMKAGAELPFQQDNAGSAALNAFIEAIATAGKPKKIHLVGHSTGMILLSHLLQRLAVLSPALTIESVSLMAPAGTLDLFTSHMQPYLKAKNGEFRIRKMAIYNLIDDLEQDDEVTKAYNKSLLYLVSRAFEEKIPERILGMQNYSKTIERRKIARLKIYYSKGDIAQARVTASEIHGGFDNDPLTLNHVLKSVLGNKPDKPFTKESLRY